MKKFAREYLLAVQYFTRIPVTGALADWAGYGPQEFRASAAHFPGVGWLVGMAACVALAVISVVLPATPLAPAAAAVGCTIVTVLLTGAFHEDGLADLADGLGGSAERLRALEIMKDSRIGSFGAIALVLALLAKVALLAILATHAPASVLTALLAAHAVSRFWPLLVIRSLPHVGDDATSKSKPLTAQIDRRTVAIGALWCVPPVLLMGFAAGAASMALALAASVLGWAWMRRLLMRRLQGFTGDGLGATQQVCEIAFYFGAAIGLAR